MRCAAIMRETVEQHCLGVFVEPDDVSALAAGIRSILAQGTLTQNFECYRATASLGVNIDHPLELYGSLVTTG